MKHFRNGFRDRNFVFQTGQNTLKRCNVRFTISVECFWDVLQQTSHIKQPLYFNNVGIVRTENNFVIIRIVYLVTTHLFLMGRYKYWPCLPKIILSDEKYLFDFDYLGNKVTDTSTTYYPFKSMDDHNHNTENQNNIQVFSNTLLV